MSVRQSRVEKHPKSLTLAEVGARLSGQKGSGASAKLFTDFLVKAATPFNPEKIGRKHDLIVFHGNGSGGSAEIDRGRAESIYVMRDFFLHFIYCTSRYRYPRVKQTYRKNPFWGDSPPSLPFLEK